MERAEFTSRLVEATIRLTSLGDHEAGDQAWRSALSVVGASQDFAASGESFSPPNVRRFLTLSESNPSSVRACLARARDNARAARTALSVEVWEAINRAWLLIRDRSKPGGVQATLNLVESLKAEIRGFEGALARMLRSEGSWFLRLGAAIERGDNMARLLDVKYYLLLPPGQEVGGALDRDQWGTLLADRLGEDRLSAHLRRHTEALAGRRFPDLPPRNAALARRLGRRNGDLLSAFAARSGRQGQADRLARKRLDRIQGLAIAQVVQTGLHEWLHAYIRENAAIDQAIARQFRFG